MATVQQFRLFTRKRRLRDGQPATSRKAHQRALTHKLEWYALIYAHAFKSGSSGITLLEFVAYENERRRREGVAEQITPNIVSGRFTELGRGVKVGTTDLRLKRLAKPDGTRATRDGAGVWVIA